MKRLASKQRFWTSKTTRNVSSPTNNVKNGSIRKRTLFARRVNSVCKCVVKSKFRYVVAARWHVRKTIPRGAARAYRWWRLRGFDVQTWLFTTTFHSHFLSYKKKTKWHARLSSVVHPLHDLYIYNITTDVRIKLFYLFYIKKHTISTTIGSSVIVTFRTQYR